MVKIVFLRSYQPSKQTFFTNIEGVEEESSAKIHTSLIPRVVLSNLGLRFSNRPIFIKTAKLYASLSGECHHMVAKTMN